MAIIEDRHCPQLWKGIVPITPFNKYDQQLKHPELRKKLPHRRSFYAHTFARGRALGYFRPKNSAPGIWYARVLSAPQRHKRAKVALADDNDEANGKDILNFDDALEEAKRWCKQPEQASDYNEPYVRHINTELNACPCGSVYTVGHALADYVRWKKTFSKKGTVKALISGFNYYVYPQIGTIPANDLTSDHIRELLEHVIRTPTYTYLRLNGSDFDPSRMDPETRRRRRCTANNILAYVKGALNHAWENEKILDNRAWRRVPHFQGVKQTRIDFLTRPECRALIMASEPEVRAVVLGLLYTGCRISEILNLKVEGVSRARRAIFVNFGKHYTSRHIALPEEGYRFFRQLCFGKNSKDHVFVRHDGSHWRQDQLNKGLKRALTRAGLPKQFVSHTLRHTYASLRLQEGLSPIALARQMGHKDVRTVLQIYAHCKDDFIDEEIRKRFVPLMDGDDELTRIIDNHAAPVSAKKDDLAEAQAANALFDTRYRRIP